MKLIEIRKNPDVNIKDNIFDIVKKYDKSNHFIHFTDIPKLGINPQYRFGRSPLAIYGYPVHYVIEQNFSVNFINRDYYFIFETSSNKVFDLSKEEPNLEELKNKVIDFFKNKFTKKRIVSVNQVLKPNNLSVDEEIHTNEHLYSRIKSILETEEISSYKKGLLWNSLFRHLGFDIILDPGMRIIYSGKGEEFQVAVLNPTKIIIKYFGKNEISKLNGISKWNRKSIKSMSKEQLNFVFSQAKQIGNYTKIQDLFDYANQSILLDLLDDYLPKYINYWYQSGDVWQKDLQKYIKIIVERNPKLLDDEQFINKIEYIGLNKNNL